MSALQKPIVTAQDLSDVLTSNQKLAANIIIPLVDHTSLTGKETDAEIQKLCDEAIGDGSQPQAAAVCVYPAYVSYARKALEGTDVKVATVINFPDGGLDVEAVRRDTRKAIEAGAQEIDLVTPYGYHDQITAVEAVWKACLEECVKRGITTKLILETGAWKDLKALEDTCVRALDAGFDFLKTSTGKLMIPSETGGQIPGEGASPAAMAVFLRAIERFGKWDKGIKISGGVRSIEDAIPYLSQAIFADHPINAGTMRFGASSLLPKARSVLAGHVPNPSPGGTY